MVNRHTLIKDVQRRSNAVELAKKTAEEEGVVEDWEDPTDETAYTLHCQYKDTQKTVNDFLRKRGLVIRVLSRIPGLISREQRELCSLVADSLDELMVKYLKTTQRRKTLDQVIEVANLRGPLLRSSSLCPEELWIVSFRLFHEYDANVASLLGYDSAKLSVWWEAKQSRVVYEGSKDWRDMKALSKTVVYVIERTNEICLPDTILNDRMLRMGDEAKVAMLYLIKSLSAYYPDSLSRVALIFGYFIPILFIAENIVQHVRSMIELGTALNVKCNVINRQLDLLEPSLRSLVTCCAELLTKLQDSDTSLFAAANGRASWSAYSTENASPGASIAQPKSSPLTEAKRAILESGLAKDEAQMENFLEQVSEASHILSKHYCLDIETFRRLDLPEIQVSPVSDYILGSGSYAEVTARLSLNGDQCYAVKEYRQGSQGDRILNRVFREALIWRDLKHKNITPLVGFCFTPASNLPALVLERRQWSLEKYINLCVSLSEKALLKLLVDVASGLEYLHYSRCAHGDLRAGNVLVHKDPISKEIRAELCDFGVSFYTNESVGYTEGDRFRSFVAQTDGQIGNLCWLAPELLEKRTNSTAACVSEAGDIYSFGCVFLEVKYKRKPYQDVDYLAVATQKRAGIFPASKEQTSPTYFPFLSELWDEDPSRRPGATQLISRLNSFILEFGDVQ